MAALVRVIIIIFPLSGVTHGVVDPVAPSASCQSSTADESSFLQAAVVTSQQPLKDDRRPTHDSHPGANTSSSLASAVSSSTKHSLGVDGGQRKDPEANLSLLAKRVNYRRFYSWLALSSDGGSQAWRSSTKASAGFCLVGLAFFALLGLSLVIYALQPGTHELHDRSLWDKFIVSEDSGREPVVFTHLELSRSGGLGVVKDLYYWARCPSAVVTVLFLLYNVITVACQDLEFVANPEGAVQALQPHVSGDGTRPGLDHAATVREASGEDTLNGFYFSKILLNKAWEELGHDFHIHPVQFLGILELVVLCWHLSSLLACMYYALRFEGFTKWFRVQKLCWEVLPTLSSFSAMELLGNVHPSLMRRAAMNKVELIKETFAEKDDIDDATGKLKGMLPLAQATLDLAIWPIQTCVLSIIGFDTFLMKLRVVSALANQPGVSFGVVLPCVQFFIQVTSVIQLTSFVRNRLFIFIFGGEDSVLQEEERVLLEVYNSLLARRMYTDICASDGKGGKGSWLRFVAVILSYSDEDFQNLVFNEK